MSAPRPIPQGGDYRPHYRKRETDAFIAELEDQLRREREAHAKVGCDHCTAGFNGRHEVFCQVYAVEEHWKAQVAKLTKERDEYKFMYEGLCILLNPTQTEAQVAQLQTTISQLVEALNMIKLRVEVPGEFQSLI